MKKIILGLLGLVVVAGCSTKSEDKLTVLTSSGYEPYEIIDASGNLTGFDIELAEAIAKELGYEIEWIDMDFNGIIGSLQSGRGDFAIAAITPDEDRAKAVDFSDYYYEQEEAMENYVIALNGTSTSMDDLDGTKVGVQLGTIQESVVKEVESEFGYTVDARSILSELIQEVKVGRLQYVVVEKVVAEQFANANSDLIIFPFDVSTEESAGNAIALPKGSELTTKVNDAITKFKGDGTLDALIAKWFQK